MVILKGQLKQVLKKINKEHQSPRPSSDGSSLDSSSIFSSSLFDYMRQEDDHELRQSDLRHNHLHSNFSALDSDFFKDHSDSASDVQKVQPREKITKNRSSVVHVE